MERLFADENFPRAVVIELRRLGHDVLTTEEAGLAGQGVPDAEILRFATRGGRAVLTLNRRDFVRLHTAQPGHGGIIACTYDSDFERQARRIDAEITTQTRLPGLLLRVNRPGPAEVSSP